MVRSKVFQCTSKVGSSKLESLQVAREHFLESLHQRGAKAKEKAGRR